MRKITVNDLKELGACGEAIDWMKKTYPDGVDITDEVLLSVPDKKWIVWLASKLNPILGYTWAGIALRYAAEFTPSLAQYADNVTPENLHQAKCDVANALVFNVFDAVASVHTAYAAAINTADVADNDTTRNIILDEMIVISAQFLQE